MVFSSLFFLFLFLPLNLLLYYSTKNKDLRNLILIFFSLIFYAWGEPIWVILLVICAIVDYFNGIFICNNYGKPIAKLGVISTFIFNIGLLLTFKYSDFFVENANLIFGTAFKKPGFLLPVGISFYTFQTISYTIDVYRGEVKAQKSFLKFLLFVSLYPELVAGPIVRYAHVANEIENRTFLWSDFSIGVTRFCKGLFKKVVIANIAGSIAVQFLDTDIQSMTMLGSWYGIILYTIQIYFDFSGYSDMAIGLALMFGFHYHENFKHPYISTSITDFWRRWHISLGTFFKDYVYIPLGGNKKYQYRNILIVWLLTGFWHGASWNFVIWGLYFCILLLLEKAFLGKLLSKSFSFLQHLYTLFFIVVGWALFYYTDIEKLFNFLKVLFYAKRVELFDFELQSVFMENLYWFILAICLCMPIYKTIQQLLAKYIRNEKLVSSLNISLNLILFFISVILLVGSTYNPFIYFRF
jgi:alginate O-acetyltransferase complex protein AlgI